MLEIRECLDDLGHSSFGRWLAGLDDIAATRVAIALGRMEEGNLSNVRSVGQGVLEYRINFGPGYRIYFGRDGAALIILLGGGTKSRQERDIRDAHALWKDYRAGLVETDS